MYTVFFQHVVFDAEVKSEASHDPRGEATGKEVIIKVTNKKIHKVNLDFFVVVIVLSLLL